MTERNELSSGFFGENGVGQKAIQKRIRIYSTSEIAAMVSKFSKITGLERDQFAINGWGFPFIPLPMKKKEYGRIRNAPRNVSTSFLGHPIYWIEDELTRRRPNEGEQEWCIRMFLLIDALGYWDDKVEFLDFLKINDFSFDKAQIDTYHNLVSQECETDLYDMLSVEDIDTSLESVDEEYKRIINKCFAIQEHDSVEVIKRQVREYKFAKSALGEDVLKWSHEYDSGKDSVWSNKFRPHLDVLAREYNKRAEEENPITSDILRETRKIYNAIIKVIMRYNDATTVLDLTVKASIEGTPGGAARLSYIANAMDVANSKKNLLLTELKQIQEEIDYSLKAGNKGWGSYDKIIKELEVAYQNAWDKMHLAFINYDRLRNNESIFTTKIEMKTELQSMQTGSLGSVSKTGINTSGNLSSVLSENFSR